MTIIVIHFTSVTMLPIRLAPHHQMISCSLCFGMLHCLVGRFDTQSSAYIRTAEIGPPCQVKSAGWQVDNAANTVSSGTAGRRRVALKIKDSVKGYAAVTKYQHGTSRTRGWRLQVHVRAAADLHRSRIP